MTLVAQWIEDASKWQELAPEWDEVVRQSAHPNIFCTWDFLGACWDRFARPNGDRLALFVVKDGERLVGFAPFRTTTRRRLGFKLRRLAILPAWSNDRVHFVEPKGREEEFYSLLIEGLQDRMDLWDLLEVAEHPADGAFIAALKEWNTGRRDLDLRLEECSPSPYIELPGSWGELRSRLSKNLRKNLGRHRRKMEQQGELELEVFTSPSEISQGVDLYAEIEARSWKKEAGEGITKDERNLRFYRDLLTRVGHRGHTIIHLLKQNGRRVAGNIDLKLGGDAYSLQTVYDDSFRAYSPGNVLMELALKWHMAHGTTRYELFSQCLENKILWTRDQHSNFKLSLVQRRRLRHFATFRQAWKPQPSIVEIESEPKERTIVAHGVNAQ